jgi:hypothetical protein
VKRIALPFMIHPAAHSRAGRTFSMELSAAKTGANTQNTDMKIHIIMQCIILNLYIDTL